MKKIQVTEISSEPLNSLWTHHYMGITSSTGFAYPCWTDYRSDTGADVYFAEIDYPPAAPQNLTLTDVGYPLLQWDANNEYDIAGYNLYKELSIWTGFPPPLYDTHTFVIPCPITSYHDEDFSTGSGKDIVKYWVKAVDNRSQESSGSSNTVQARGESWIQWRQTVYEEGIPEEYSLTMNFPNPFNPATTIRYDLPEASYVSLVIYDILGREVRTILDNREEAGFKSVIWDGKDNSGNMASTGIYIYTLKARSQESKKTFHKTRKMVLLR
ncbi:MAG: FlgD immunoglobulin-like domain containing protein [Fidelibacterota bacterium]